MEQPRISYIDKLETIAVFFIAFIHYPILKTGWMDNFVICLSYAGVILFFMVNGALLLNKEYNLKKHLNRIKKMLIVLFSWEVISIVYFWWLYHVDLNIVKFGDVISYLIGGYRWIMPTGHFWFIIALVAVYILFPIIKIAFDNKKIGLQAIVLFLMGILLFVILPVEAGTIQDFILKTFNLDGTKIEFNLLCKFTPFFTPSRLPAAFMFFCLGGLMHKYFYLENKTIKYQKLVSILLILIGWVWLYILQGITVSFEGSNYTQIPESYERISAIILGIGFYMLFVSKYEITNTLSHVNEVFLSGGGIFNKMKNFINKVFEIISKNSIGFFYLHCLFLGAISYHIYPHIIQYAGITANIIKSIITMGLCLITIWIMKKIPILKKIL